MDQQTASDWRKSSYSGNGGGNCVEAGTGNRAILIRDTANRAGGTLSFSARAWTAFLASVTGK